MKQGGAKSPRLRRPPLALRSAARTLTYCSTRIELTIRGPTILIAKSFRMVGFDDGKH